MALTLHSACPSCGASDQIFRSRWRGAMEKALCLVFMVRPVRCDWCHRRHFRPVFLRAPRRRQSVPDPLAANSDSGHAA